MRHYFKVPKKIPINGNRAVGDQYIGVAEKRLRILHEDTQRRNLNINSSTFKIKHNVGPEGTRDVIIDCNICFGVPEILITVGPVIRPTGEDKYECLCNCNFSVGIILAVNDIPDEAQYKALDILICRSKDRYKLYRNIIGSDFTPWEAGMKVIVLAYNDFLYDCCQQNFNATGCKPIIMPEDENHLPHTEDWRTTYRVMPFCGLGIPKWVRIP